MVADRVLWRLETRPLTAAANAAVWMATPQARLVRGTRATTRAVLRACLKWNLLGARHRLLDAVAASCACERGRAGLLFDLELGAVLASWVLE